jgi:hypothetical protein
MMGEPSVVVTLNPTKVSDATPISVKIAAVGADGKIGTGTVRVTSARGSLATGKELALDAYGTARTEFVCDPKVEAACLDTVRVFAEWSVKGAAAIGDARINAGSTGGTGGMGGVGGIGGTGSTAPGDHSYETDSRWRVVGLFPGADWFRPDFDDSAWGYARVAKPKSADPSLPGDAIWDDASTTGGSLEVWFRKTFSVYGTVVESVIDFGCDDDMQVYLNGVHIVDDRDGVTTRETISAVGPLLEGQNAIAISCKDVVLPEHALWGKHTITTQ